MPNYLERVITYRVRIRVEVRWLTGFLCQLRRSTFLKAGLPLPAEGKPHMSIRATHPYESGLETTFGNADAGVLAGKEPFVRPENFCHVIRASAWPS